MSSELRAILQSGATFDSTPASDRPVSGKSEKDRINTGDLWWAWVDLSHRPRPYQGSVVRLYNNL
jgi:hypothetical protein